MNTYISTSEYMFQASVMFNKKLKDCTKQELASIRLKVQRAQASRRLYWTDELRKKYGC